MNCVSNVFFFSYIFSALFDLQQNIEERCKCAFRPGTISNHRTHFRNYIRFCIYFGLVDLPASGNTLSLFSEFLCRTYLAPASVLNALSSIEFYHSLLDFSLTGFSSFRFLLTKRALPRSVRFEPHPAEPITIDILRQLSRLCNKLGPQGLAFKTLCLVSFHSLARLSTLVPATQSRPDLTRSVLISDVAVTPSGFNLVLKWSKTHQFL